MKRIISVVVKKYIRIGPWPVFALLIEAATKTGLSVALPHEIETCIAIHKRLLESVHFLGFFLIPR